LLCVVGVGLWAVVGLSLANGDTGEFTLDGGSLFGTKKY
jgi:hypothetical protein